MSVAHDYFTAALHGAKRQEDRDMAQLVTLTKALGVSRDYRKECWIATQAAALSCAGVTTNDAIHCADKTLAAFDERFPPL
jgi:hypothetical protein